MADWEDWVAPATTGSPVPEDRPATFDVPLYNEGHGSYGQYLDWVGELARQEPEAMALGGNADSAANLVAHDAILGTRAGLLGTPLVNPRISNPAPLPKRWMNPYQSAGWWNDLGLDADPESVRRYARDVNSAWELQDDPNRIAGEVIKYGLVALGSMGAGMAAAPAAAALGTVGSAAASGAAAGATGAAFNAADRGEWDWGQFLTGVGTGAISGGAGAYGQGLGQVGRTAVGAGTGMATRALADAAQGRNLDWGAILGSGVAGGIGASGVGSGTGSAWGDRATALMRRLAAEYARRALASGRANPYRG